MQEMFVKKYKLPSIFKAGFDFGYTRIDIC